MALPPFALFVVSEKITADHINRALTDEATNGSYLLAPVIEPALSSPYSATPRRIYDAVTGKELPAAEYPPPISQQAATALAQSPFIGATLEVCAAYLRASACVNPAWDTEFFAVMDEQYLTHGTILVAHSYIASYKEETSPYCPEYIKCYRDGVQAYPSEKGMVTAHMSLRTGQDFQEDLEMYQRVCKSSGVEDRSIGTAWDLFKEKGDENATSVPDELNRAPSLQAKL